VLASVVVAGTMMALKLHHNSVLLILIPVAAGFSAIGAMCVSFFLMGRLSLLSTHAAIGGAIRVRKAWADTRGHYWSIVLTQASSMAPVFVFWILVAVAGPAVRRQGHGMLYPFTAALAYVETLYVGAACAAWLYRRYASALRGVAT
jgi:hypothetical protein